MHEGSALQPLKSASFYQIVAGPPKSVSSLIVAKARACDLIERRGLKRFQARTCMHFGNVILPMAEHVRAGRELLHRAFVDANKVGDLIYEAYYGVHATTNRLFAGDSLAEAQRGAEDGLA